MRPSLSSLAGTLVVALLGGWSVGVAAQAPADDSIGTTYVVGSTTATRSLVAPSIEPELPRHNAGYGGFYEREIDWSDPRLPSLMLSVENWDYYYVGDMDGAISLVRTVRLEGPDGAWTGTEYALLEELAEQLGDEGTYPGTWLMLLTGEGAYEGLSAMFTRTYTNDPPVGEEAWVDATYEGYLFEGGLPPVPEVPPSSAE